ncbi:MULTISPECIES: asparaginase [unclassified Burkholderia]|uniref:asparaginase n=1 Tax=unclassified Burkholderia TaxID=2613784 RepID=UPI002AAF27B2|nr:MULTISPECIES: asparaginase [unclassified Burkholderia]
MQSDTNKVVVLATGGTIAGAAAARGDTLHYTAAQLSIGELLAGIPAFDDLPVIAEQVAQIDSRDMNLDVWRRLAERCAYWLEQADVAGIIVTHGTDTLEETAFFLQEVLAPTKPLVLTAAMRPATALLTDGPQNLVDAVTVALVPDARGVVVVCNGTIHGAEDVTKTHPWRVDAFGSGDAGPIGYVEAGSVRLMRAWPSGSRTADGNPAALLQKVLRCTSWPRVEIVMNHAGADGMLVFLLLENRVQGIVAAGTGNGSLGKPLKEALLVASKRGIPVVRATRCAEGHVLGKKTDELPDSHGLSAVKARIAMQLRLLQ